MSTLVLQNKSSFEYLFCRTPNYNFLCIFGCLCFSFFASISCSQVRFSFLSMCVFRIYLFSSWLLLSWFSISTYLCLTSCLFLGRCFSFREFWTDSISTCTLHTPYTPPNLESSPKLSASCSTTLPNQHLCPVIRHTQ